MSRGLVQDSLAIVVLHRVSASGDKPRQSGERKEAYNDVASVPDVNTKVNSIYVHNHS